MTSPLFRFSLLSMALAAGFAHAENEAKESVTLDTVTVKGDRQGSKVKTNIVTLRQKDESTSTDLRELLKEEPAIDFGGGNGTSQHMTLRGMGQNSVDIKVDNAYSDSQILYHQGRFIIDPALVKIVSVQKGAGSASAGIGATNGAIITKTVDAEDLLKGLDKNWGVRLSSGYASNDGVNYGASVFGKAGNFDGLFSYNRNDEKDYEAGKGYKSPNGGKTVPYSALDKRSHLAKIGTTFGDGDHRIVLSHMKDQHRGIRTVREEFTIFESDPAKDRQKPSYRETTQSNTNLEYTGKNLGFVEKLNANAYVLENERYSADDSGSGYAGNVAGPTTTKITTKGANINFDSRLAEKTLLKYGVNYRHQEIKPHTFLNSQYTSTDAALQSLVRGYSLTNPTKTDYGVYVEAIQDIGDVTLTGGLRYDHFDIKTHDGKSVSDGKVNPSLGVIYQPVENLSFSVSHNYASRSPRLYDALQTHGKRGIISIADGTKAERARNTEIGFNFERNGFNVEGSYFWQNISNALGTSNGRNNHICPSTGPSANCYQEIINAGRIKNRGYELSVGYRQGGFTARLGVAHAKPRFYGDNLSSNPEYASAIGRTWTASLAYRFENPNLEIGIQHRQVERVKAADNYFVINGGIVPTPATGKAGYGVTDVSLNWKPLRNDKMNVNFGIDNLTNKLYYPHAQRGQFPGEGRQYRFSMNYTF